LDAVDVPNGFAVRNCLNVFVPDRASSLRRRTLTPLTGQRDRSRQFSRGRGRRLLVAHTARHSAKITYDSARKSINCKNHTQRPKFAAEERQRPLEHGTIRIARSAPKLEPRAVQDNVARGKARRATPCCNQQAGVHCGDRRATPRSGNTPEIHVHNDRRIVRCEKMIGKMFKINAEKCFWGQWNNINEVSACRFGASKIYFWGIFSMDYTPPWTWSVSTDRRRS
jgi:hypothetical protein